MSADTFLSNFRASIGRPPFAKGRPPINDEVFMAYKELQLGMRYHAELHIQPKLLNHTRVRINTWVKNDGFPVKTVYDKPTSTLTMYRTVNIHTLDHLTKSKYTENYVYFARPVLKNRDRYAFGMMQPAFHLRDFNLPRMRNGKHPLMDRREIREGGTEIPIESLNDADFPDTVFTRNGQLYCMTGGTQSQPFYYGDIIRLGPFHRFKHGYGLIEHFLRAKEMYERRYNASIELLNPYVTYTVTKPRTDKITELRDKAMRDYSPQVAKGRSFDDWYEIKHKWKEKNMVYVDTKHRLLEGDEIQTAIDAFINNVPWFLDPDDPVTETATTMIEQLQDIAEDDRDLLTPIDPDDPDKFYLIYRKVKDGRYNPDTGEKLDKFDLSDHADHEAMTYEI